MFAWWQRPRGQWSFLVTWYWMVWILKQTLVQTPALYISHPSLLCPHLTNFQLAKHTWSSQYHVSRRGKMENIVLELSTSAGVGTSLNVSYKNFRQFDEHVISNIKEIFDIGVTLAAKMFAISMVYRCWLYSYRPTELALSVGNILTWTNGKDKLMSVVLNLLHVCHLVYHMLLP